MSLTDRTIRGLEPKAKTYRKWDEDGLFIEVRPNGSKYFRMKFKLGGTWKGLAFGVYPQVSLSEARRHRAAARQLLASGTDPTVERKRAKAASNTKLQNTFEAVARDFVEKQKARWTPY